MGRRGIARDISRHDDALLHCNKRSLTTEPRSLWWGRAIVALQHETSSKGPPMKFEPFAQMNKAFETWNKLATDAMARTAAYCAELDQLDTRTVERADTALSESAKLTRETLAYGAQL